MKACTSRGLTVLAVGLMWMWSAAVAPAQWVKSGTLRDGTVKATAVRAGPGEEFKKIGQLSGDEQVSVLEMKNGYSRISVPGVTFETADAAPKRKSAAAPVPAAAPAAQSGASEGWVKEAYVKNGQVDTGNPTIKLSLRAGPGLEHKTVGTVEDGKAVGVLDTRNGWALISLNAVSAPAAAPAAEPVPRKVIPVQVNRGNDGPAAKPPVSNLIVGGDFSGVMPAVPAASGAASATLSGRWLRSGALPWDAASTGGNLGAYLRAPNAQDPGRLLYVVQDGKRGKGTYQLRLDYLMTNPSDVLGVKVFVSDRDITVGTSEGQFKLDSTQRPSDLVMLPPVEKWTAYTLPVELGEGYEFVYVLFMGSGLGNTGVDNVSLIPQH